MVDDHLINDLSVCYNSDTVNNCFATIFEPRCEKTGLGVSDQVRHKPGCTATEDGVKLEIKLGLDRRGIKLSV